MVAGCVVEPNGRVTLGLPVIAPAPVVYAPAPAPVVYAPAPAPVMVAPAPEVVVAPAMVPEAYVWDGYEYVGVVGNQYYYLGPGNVWLVAEPFRLERFHGWERGHADWRTHAIRNEQYRTDRNGHVQPRHEPGKNETRKDDREAH